MEGGWQKLGEAIAAERVRRRLTHQELADAAGLSARTIGYLEEGHRQRYQATTFEGVERVFDWPHGGCLEIVARGAFRRRRDPDLQWIIDAWPRLPAAARAGVRAGLEAALDSE